MDIYLSLGKIVRKLLASLTVLFLSSPSSAQSIECQMLRDDILSERRQQQQQQQQAQQYGSAGSMGNPSLAPLYAQAAQQGQLLGQGIGGLMGVPNLQQKIQIYKQKCE
jgi:hypothetical protein